MGSSSSIQAALSEKKSLSPKARRTLSGFREDKKRYSMSPSFRKVGHKFKLFHNEIGKEEKEFIQLVLKGTPKDLSKFLSSPTKRPTRMFQEVAVAAQMNGLQVCCRYGWLNKAKILIQEGGFDINFQSPESLLKTPLHFACMFGHILVVQWLLSLPGIDPNLRDDKGRTPVELIRETELKSQIEDMFQRPPSVAWTPPTDHETETPFESLSPSRSPQGRTKSVTSVGSQPSQNGSSPSASPQAGSPNYPKGAAVEMKTFTTNLDTDQGNHERILTLETLQRECQMLRSDVLRLKEENYRMEIAIIRLQERQDGLCCSIL